VKSQPKFFGEKERQRQKRNFRRLKMTYEEKLKWLGRLFSNDPSVRRQAMEEDIPQPLFQTGEEFGKAIDEWLAGSYTEQQGKTDG
jgi:hypothetical protein